MAFNSYAEGLKNASTIANRAISAESSLSGLSPLVSALPTLQRAFGLYVSAAESYSYLLASSVVPTPERAGIQRKWRLVLDRAEKVKRRIEELGGRVGVVEVDEAAEEAAVLRRGERMNGVQLGIWRVPPDGEFVGERFVDDQPELAQEQIRLDPHWAELPPSAWEGSSSWNVRQGPGADCSVTAGLGACLAHNSRWGGTLGQDALYPQSTPGHPRRSENAKHVVKLLLNGAWRSVVVDALLPQSPTGAPLHITTGRGRSPSPAWLPLAVKGYFKALGGYSIPGSNPAPDVYAFTGWIPERLDLNSGFQREKEWNRVSTAWKNGSVIVTLGSGKDAESKGLVKWHAYGVVDVREDGDERVLQIFDPGTAKAAKASLEDTAEALEGLGLDDSDWSFTMSWDEVCSKFETLNLNWDPTLFPVTTERHWSWPKPSPSGDEDQLRSAPRYNISATATKPDAELWLLLSQHDVSREIPMDDVALHVFRDMRGGGGKLSPTRVQHSTTPYANAMHTLVRFPLRQGENVLNAVASRDKGTTQMGFTLRAFATAGTTLEMTRVSLNLSFSETVTGCLTKRSAGGHPGYATHHLNPQYRLTVGSANNVSTGRKATLRLSLQGARDLAWDIKLLWGKGERVFELTSDAILASSGPYSYGMAFVETTVDPGTYTLLVSSWEREQVGTYSLLAESSAPVTLSPIPQEGAGMFARSIQGRWDEDTAGGRPSEGNYSTNPAVEITLPTAAVLQARLYLPTPGNVPTNLTLFRRGTGGIGEQLATSGPYVEAVSGVAVSKTRLSPGVYLLIPSTYQRGVRNEWILDIWADKAFSAELKRSS